MPDLSPLVTLGVAAITAVGGFMAGRPPKSREHRFIDQQQEEIARLRAEQNAAIRREFALRTYVFELWAHIGEGKPPPPPPIPREFYDQGETT